MSNTRFDLETAIATWCRFLRSERSITAENADELESHLHDEVDDDVHRLGQVHPGYMELAVSGGPGVDHFAFFLINPMNARREVSLGLLSVDETRHQQGKRQAEAAKARSR